jgi:DNA-binding HxlR family transcriptional regulator
METAASVGCPVARTATIIGNRWTPLIVRDLAGGHRRFSELERSLAGISPKTLSERLRRLEQAGVVTRACFAEVPPRVEYTLTPKGRALLPIIESMRQFGSKWLESEPCDPAETD